MKTKLASLITIALLGLGALAAWAQPGTQVWVQRYDGPGDGALNFINLPVGSANFWRIRSVP